MQPFRYNNSLRWTDGQAHKQNSHINIAGVDQ